MKSNAATEPSQQLKKGLNSNSVDKSLAGGAPVGNEVELIDGIVRNVVVRAAVVVVVVVEAETLGAKAGAEIEVPVGVVHGGGGGGGEEG